MTIENQTSQSMLTDGQPETLELFWLRGEPGKFTDIVSAQQLSAQDSRELREQSFQSVGGYRLPSRVLPAQRWWDYYAHSAVHSGCCDTKARDIVGGGFTIEPGRQAVSDALIEQMTGLVEDNIEQLNDACRDWEATGWCGLECLPTRGGNELAALNHLDSWTLWPIKDGGGVIHMRDGKWVRYSPLGAREPDAYQCAFLNNNHWYKSTYYGVPDIISAIIQIESSWEALRYNQEFFARRGGYRWLLTLRSTMPGGGDPGSEGDAKLVQTINYKYKQIGKDSASDMLIIPLGTREATLQRMDADMKDMDFPAMLERYRNEIIMRHGVPPLRLGIVETGSLGGNIGQEQLRSYNDNVVRPKQRRWGRFLTGILRSWFGVDVTLEFEGLEFDELAGMTAPAVNLFRSLVASRREVREILDLPDLDDGVDVWFDELQPDGPFGQLGLGNAEAQPA